MKVRPFALILATSLLVAVPGDIYAQSFPQSIVSPTEISSSGNKYLAITALSLQDWVKILGGIVATMVGLVTIYKTFKHYNDKHFQRQLEELLNSNFKNNLPLKEAFEQRVQEIAIDNAQDIFGVIQDDNAQQFIENLEEALASLSMSDEGKFEKIFKTTINSFKNNFKNSIKEIMKSDKILDGFLNNFFNDFEQDRDCVDVNLKRAFKISIQTAIKSEKVIDKFLDDFFYNFEKNPTAVRAFNQCLNSSIKENRGFHSAISDVIDKYIKRSMAATVTQIRQTLDFNEQIRTEIKNLEKAVKDLQYKCK